MNRKLKKCIPAAIPGGLGFLFLTLTRLSFLALVLLGIGLVCLGFGLLPAGWKRILLVAITLVGFLLIAVPGIYVWKCAAGEENGKSQYVILLGCQVRGTAPSPTLRERILVANDYLQAHPDAICIVSGGKGNDEAISEAACMAQVLTSLGIPENRIWLEDQATNTMENLRFSLALIERKAGATPSCVTIISSETHLARAKLMAQGLGLTVSTVASTTHPWLLAINNGLREVAAIWKYILIGG